MTWQLHQSRISKSALPVALSIALIGAPSLGCGTRGARTSDPSPTTATAETASHGTEPATPVEPTPVVEEVPVGAAPAVVVGASIDPYGRVEVSVANHGDAETELASTLVLDEASGETFRAAEGRGPFVIGAELATDGCIRLVPGAELRARYPCLDAARTDLRACRPPSGRYRFAAVACRGAARTEGAPLTIE